MGFKRFGARGPRVAKTAQNHAWVRRYLGKRGVKTLKFMKGSCIKLGSRRVALRCDVNMQYGRAEIFDRQYGAMLRRPPLSELTSARYLLRALEAKGIVVPEGVLKQWLLKYRTGDAATTIEIQTQFIYLYTIPHILTYIHT